MKKIYLTSMFLLLSLSMMAQKSLNNYKYIIVSDKFDFLKKPDQYKTSSLTKFLFNKYGFKAFLNNEKLPQVIQSNRCGTLYANIEKLSGMFSTKTVIVLRDCTNTIVFKSIIGKSKFDEYRNAYHDAIRKSFKDPLIQNYVYKEDVVNKKNKRIDKKITVETNSTKLYAQAINNGYQLVDSNPKIIFLIIKTSLKDIYIVKGKDGILYKNGNNWIAEYYKDGNLVKQEFEIKF